MGEEGEMAQEMENREIRERLDLIESMIAEGRRRTENWGWLFVLWGVAYFVAVAWASLDGSPSVVGRQSVTLGNMHVGFVWPVTMLTAAALTLAIGLRKGKGQPATVIGEAVVAVWNGVGISMFPLFFALSFTGKLDEHGFVAIVAAFLGATNWASGMILKWRMQIACAVVWWVASVAACFGSEAQLEAIFLAAVFLCQIVFGVYAMICESRRRVHGAVHA
jgi:hypothetical protein